MLVVPCFRISYFVSLHPGILYGIDGVSQILLVRIEQVSQQMDGPSPVSGAELHSGDHLDVQGLSGIHGLGHAPHVVVIRYRQGGQALFMGFLQDLGGRAAAVGECGMGM